MKRFIFALAVSALALAACGGEDNPPKKEMQPLEDIVLTQEEGADAVKTEYTDEQ